MKPLCMMLFSAFVCAFTGAAVKAQTPVANQLAVQVPITATGVTEGALLSLPDDYATSTTTYPLLVFLHGKGEAGTNLANIYNHSGAGGPAYFIARNQFPTSFTNPADGKVYKFIIVSPQAPSYSTSGPQVNYIIQDMVKKYRVDVNRIYLSGISAGGDGAVAYVTRTLVNPFHLVAAMVPMSAAISTPTALLGTVIGNDNIRAWGFGSYAQDIFGENTSKLMDVINLAKPGTARYTDYKGGHCCWNTYYNPTYKETINGVSMNIYEWMLQFSRANIGTPVNNPPVASAGTAQTITLPTNSITLNGTSSRDTDGSITNYAWTKTAGPGTFSISSPSASTTSVTGLVAGTYTFNLTVTDNAGATNSATVNITVNAAPAANQPPVANAGPDQTIYLPQDSALLSGSGSDIDGSIVKYEWNTVSAPAGGSSNPSTPSAPRAKPGGKGYILKPDAQGYLVINGGVYKGGDTLYLDGYFKSVAIQNISGASDNYITVTNMPGKTLVVGDSLWTGGAWAQALVFRGCHYIDVFGSTKNNFKVVGCNTNATDAGGNPVKTAYFDLSFSELTDNIAAHDITIRHGGAGLWAKTELNTKDSKTWFPNTYLNNWEFYNLDIFNTYNEAVYIGHTASYWNINTNQPLYPNPGDPTPDPSIYKRPIKLTNVKIHDIYVHDIGNDGIQTAAIDGLEIWNNEVANWATKHESAHNGGLLIGGRVKGFNVHDNYVHDGWGELIQVYAEGGATSTINNNLLVRNQGEGISMRGTDNLIVSVTNNTVAYTGANSARLNGYFGQTGNQLFNKNLFVTPKTSGGAVNATSYIYVENGAKVAEGTSPNDNKKYANFTNLLVDEPNFFQPLTTSPVLGYGYKRGNSTPSNHTIVNPGSPVTWVKGLAEGTYVFRLTVTDNSGATHSDEVTVVVRPSVNNKAPKANAGNDKTITLPTSTATLDGSGTDEDGTVTGYAWKKLTGPATFTIASATSASTAVNNLVEGVYEFELTVTDNIGAAAKDTVKVTVNAGNKLPVVNAGTDVTITLPVNSVTVNGTATDADGTISSTNWSRISGPTQFTISNAANLSTDITNLIEGDYEFVLQATDNKGGVGKDTIKISVKAAANQSPVVSAGTDITITLPVNSVTLNGSASDVDGTINSTAWAKVAGPAQFTITNAGNVNTTVTNLVAGDYDFELTVTDNNGAVSKDTIRISVKAPGNQAPTVNAGSDLTITLPVNSVTLTGTASDNDGTINSTAWTKIAGPAQFTIANAFNLTTAITGLAAGEYEFVLTATDNDGAAARDTIKVSVKVPANKAPVVNAGGDLTITLPVNNVTLNGTATDADGTISTTVWSKLAGPATFNIGTPNALSTSVTNLVSGAYDFVLTATDDNGAVGKDTVRVVVKDAAIPNVPPIADAGNDVTITLPTNTATLTGYMSDDPDGTIQQFSWSYVSGPAQYTIANSGVMITSAQNLVEGVYKFRLTVTDIDGATGTDDVTITVKPMPNQPPFSDAGGDKTITLPTNSVTLDGTNSGDKDGSITNYSWTYISGPSQYSIVSAASATTVVNNLVAGVYTFMLTVTDDDGAKANNTVQVTVNKAPNQAPTANAGTDKTITLPTNSVTLNGSGIDTDGTITGYNWSYVNGPSQYSILSAANASTVINQLVEGVYTFRLRVTDNAGATATSNVTVTVNKAPNQAPTANAGTNQTITLPASSVTLSGSGTDNDGSITKYAWAYVSGPTTYTIVNSSSASTGVNGLVAGVYRFRLTVTDNEGLTGTSTVQVTVNDAANVPPTANAGNNQTITLPNNTVTLNGSGADTDGTISRYAWTWVSGPATYNIVSRNTASTMVNLLVEGIYVFRLTVTDNSGATASSQVTVTVNKTPNQAPTVNAGSNQTITLPNNTVTLSGSASDVDGAVTGYRWTYVSGPSQYSIANATSASTALNGLVEGVYMFRLTATDDDGATASATVVITVNEKPNDAPVANAGPDQTVNPTPVIVLDGTASYDPDGYIASYNWVKVSGPDPFTMTDFTTPRPNLFAALPGTYKFLLTVTDNRGAEATDEVTIVVRSDNQAPIADAGVDTVIYFPSDSYTLLGGNSRDNDGRIVKYSWKRKEGGNAVFNDATMANPTVRNLSTGKYIFQLTVTDDEGLTATDEVVVEVKNDHPYQEAIIIYPNPVESTLKYMVFSDRKETAAIAILDINGRIVKKQETQIVAGPNSGMIDVANLASRAVYVFQVTYSDGTKKAIKFLKK